MLNIFSTYKDINLNLQNDNCLVCLNKIKSDNELLSCNQCNKVLHRKCIQEWFNYKQECPYCRFKNIINIEDQNYYYHRCLNMYLRILTISFSMSISLFLIFVYLFIIKVIY